VVVPTPIRTKAASKEHLIHISMGTPDLAGVELRGEEDSAKEAAQPLDVWPDFGRKKLN